MSKERLYVEIGDGWDITKSAAAGSIEDDVALSRALEASLHMWCAHAGLDIYSVLAQAIAWHGGGDHDDMELVKAANLYIAGQIAEEECDSESLETE